jgi:diacylglycerol kinase family enzyme
LADVERFSASRILCEPASNNGKPVMLQVDGELAGPLPCTIELVPDALTLLVPAR